MKEKLLFALITGILLLTLIVLILITVRYFTYENLFGKECRRFDIGECPAHCVVSPVDGENICHSRE